MKKIFEKIITPPLHLIRYFLTILKRHCWPNNYVYNAGIKSLENNITKTSFDLFEEEEKNKSFNHFKKYFLKSIFFDNSDLQRKYSISKALKNDKDQNLFYLEFGVWKGNSINLFSKFLKTEIYGFDSFLGLKEDWKGGYINHPSGRYSLQGKIPRLNKNVIAIKGWAQDTLAKFIDEKKPKINFVHLDVDTYESTKFILENIKPNLANNAILLFDELYDFPGWQVGEYKALTEVFNESEYRFLAFHKFYHMVTIQYQKKIKFK